MIYTTYKGIVAAIILGTFGLFLIWRGITGDIIKTTDGKAFIPKWMYIFGGIVILILPVAFLIVRFGIN